MKHFYNIFNELLNDKNASIPVMVDDLSEFSWQELGAHRIDINKTNLEKHLEQISAGTLAPTKELAELIADFLELDGRDQQEFIDAAEVAENQGREDGFFDSQLLYEYGVIDSPHASIRELNETEETRKRLAGHETRIAASVNQMDDVSPNSPLWHFKANEDASTSPDVTKKTKSQPKSEPESMPRVEENRNETNDPHNLRNHPANLAEEIPVPSEETPQTLCVAQRIKKTSRAVKAGVPEQIITLRKKLASYFKDESGEPLKDKKGHVVNSMRMQGGTGLSGVVIVMIMGDSAKLPTHMAVSTLDKYSKAFSGYLRELGVGEEKIEQFCEDLYELDRVTQKIKHQAEVDALSR